MELNLTKVQGSENEFFILDQTDLTRSLTREEIDQLRLSLCDRTSGLLGGADGLLVVEAPSHDYAMAKMKVINRDGSEASMCGNGLRTVARHLAEKSKRTDFVVETMHADLKVRQSSDIGEGVTSFQVEISPVSFLAETIPMYLKKRQTLINKKIPELSKTLRFSVVAVPNPHLIAFVDQAMLASDIQLEIAKKVNGPNEWFPEGINVSFVVINGPDEIFVRTYERGIGFTNACGTAMCAASLLFVLLHNGEFNEELTVTNPGGLVKTVVHQDPEGNYWMELIGNATITHYLKGNLSSILQHDFSEVSIRETEEQKKYTDFLAQLKA